MIRKNERALLYLLSHFDKISKIELVKRSFLVSQANKIYDYIPYKYGPFSFQIYQDLTHLEKNGYIKINDDKISLIKNEFPEPDASIRRTINYHMSKYGEMDSKQIREYVYDNYPFYTIFSKIEKKIEYNPNEKGIVTIGYEGKSVDRFLLDLIKNKVNTLVDVRKNAYSMKYGFSKNQISRYVNEINIKYMHISNLGIESSKRKDLNDENDYRSLFSDYESQLSRKEEELDILRDLAKREKIALMCFEENSSFCHRGIIGNKLEEEGFTVVNI